MSGYVSKPILAIFGITFSLVIIVAVVVILSQSGVGGSSISTALVSTNSNLTNLIPYVAVIIVTGVVIGALGSRRSH